MLLFRPSTTAAVAALGSQAVHLVAYVGDADGNGAYSSNDAVLITRVALQTDTGFAAYPLVDPVIVADTDGSGFIPADAALQANEAGVGFSTANLPIPPIPSGVHFAANIFKTQHLMEPVHNTLLPTDKAVAPANAFPAAVLPVDLLMASSDLLDDVPTGLTHKRGSPLPSVVLRPRVLDQFFASPSANATAACLFPA